MAAANILDFPEEVSVAIIEKLQGKEIKTIRATCKKLNRIASPYLFRVLYISCHQLDLDVFRVVVNNPLLIGGVRELVIDDTTMSSQLSDERLFHDLASHREAWVNRDVPYIDNPNVHFLHQKKIREPLRGLSEGTWVQGPDNALWQFYMSVLKGHHENRLAHTDVLTLQDALPHLKSLRSLVITNRNADESHSTGAQSLESTSPLVKMWRRFGTQRQERPPFPPRCDWLYDPSTPNGLSQVKTFDWLWDRLEQDVRAYGLPFDNDEDTFHRRQMASDRLHLFLDGNHGPLGQPHGGLAVSDGQFSRVLASLPNLRDLLLEPHGICVFTAVPKDTTFARLSSVEINCADVHPKKFIKFLRRHGSTLKTLRMRWCNINPEVHEETWEGVMDQLFELHNGNILSFGEAVLTRVYEWYPLGCGRRGRDMQAQNQNGDVFENTEVYGFHSWKYDGVWEEVPAWPEAPILRRSPVVPTFICFPPAF
ncbi:hypothetical protein FGRMN_5182 [Fusarium graminum]|nr:hypothetical protein FGRMN_5182 [Fusarium graminum]